MLNFDEPEFVKTNFMKAGVCVAGLENQFPQHRDSLFDVGEFYKLMSHGDKTYLIIDRLTPA